jgi:hypothetical protein
MKLFFKLISLVAAISAIASCGSSEKAEDILKLGGISSTGNKEDEESNEPQQDANSPIVAEICKKPLDLSPRIYRNTALARGVKCVTDAPSNSCIIEFKFEDLSSFTATYAGHSLESPSITHAEYKACQQSLVTSIHGPSDLKISEDKKSITDQKLGLVFELVQ